MAKLDDPDLRTRLCDLIRLGHGRYEAAVAVGISLDTYRRYYKANADFREEIDAATDASVEPIMTMLRKEAIAGDITAAKEYLKHQAPPPRSEREKEEATLKITLDAEVISSINDLRARLAGRTAPELSAPEDIEDAEIVEED